MFLTVLPMKGVMRFDKKGKLVSRYIGPFEILKKVGIVAYRLALPSSVSLDSSFSRTHLRKSVSLDSSFSRKY